MTIIQVIMLLLGCAIATFFMYGIWLVENDIDEFRKEHGYKPKYHDWKANDKDQDQ